MLSEHTEALCFTALIADFRDKSRRHRVTLCGSVQGHPDVVPTRGAHVVSKVDSLSTLKKLGKFGISYSDSESLIPLDIPFSTWQTGPEYRPISRLIRVQFIHLHLPAQLLLQVLFQAPLTKIHIFGTLLLPMAHQVLCHLIEMSFFE